MLEPFMIPDDFRAFMRAVAANLDDEAFQHECGHGGRAFGSANFNFTYLAADGQSRWELSLREQQILDIADGTITEIEGIRDDMVRTQRRAARGPALLVWGEYREDAVRIHTPFDLVDALDTLHAASAEDPRMLRLWSTGDDQVVAIVYRDDAVLYVVESVEGYGTSEGNPSRAGAFTALDHENQSVTVLWSECVDWTVAREALVHFSDHGELGAGVTLSGSIPSGFLMMGDFDRAAVVSARGEPPGDLHASSLPRMVPPTRFDPNITWAERLIDELTQHAIVRIADGSMRALVVDHVAGLLTQYGNDAIRDGRTAEWLATEVVRVQGVDGQQPTGSELATMLRRTR